MQQNPAYNLKKMTLVVSQFEIPGPDFEPEENLDLGINIDNTEVNSDKEFDVKLGIVLRDPDTKNEFIHVSYVGRFQLLREQAEINLKDFSQVNAPAIIYPYIRQHVRALSLEAGFSQPIILPIINFVELRRARDEHAN